mmetsp:Transcript_19833/g.25010  ORF Transcript_19833/g.25010 Transcript_19833/m.25010 type:complete len:109 (+) Transcript_19833:71-397(+)
MSHAFVSTSFCPNLVCWNKDILASLKNMKRYVEVNDPEAKSVKPSNTLSTSNENWLSDAQARMESVENMEVLALVGKLFNLSKRFASKFDHTEILFSQRIMTYCSNFV